MSRNVLTAVAWPYANGPRHIGHVAGFGVPSDVFSRYQRMAGNSVLMVSGTDEHGTPIQVQADREGVTARELADRYNRVIAEDLQGLGLSYDVANTAPNIVYELLHGGVLTAVVVPLLVRAAKDDEDGGQAYAQRLLTLVVLAGSIFPWLALGVTGTKVDQLYSLHDITADPDEIDPDEVAGEHETLAGDMLTVEGEGEDFTIGDASVVCGNVQTANATVYVVDQVLMPEM